LLKLKNEILYEDNHLIALNKYPSDIVQGDKTGDLPLGDYIKSYLIHKYNKPGDAFLGVIHRIDRPVSGVVIFAKTSKGLSRMNKLLKDGGFHKTYWAIVEGTPLETDGLLINHLAKNERQNKSYVVSKGTKGAKEAKLRYHTLQAGRKYSLLEIELLTGRHHQIRVQLSNMGCPIKGDLKYGSKRSNSDKSICLHARTLEFEHPISKKNICITAPKPQSDIWHVFESF
jgi:23S rRNA pseudouridine1911/1915/1917 synthase